ncbi:MAG: ATP-binding protein, partial [Dolichospermum sp.]
RLMVERTGKHLDDLQKAVIIGTWERQTYEDIAQQYSFHKNYVGDVGAGLWQLLSEELGEEINKLNFRSTIERLRLDESAVIIQNHSKNNNSFNVCNYPSQLTQKSQEYDKNKNYHDLTLAPQIIKFYNRKTELETLSNWILNQNIRLISVLGLSGIGKTTLV